MKTILSILTKAGGWRPSLHVRIENPPYLPLVIEAVDETGPLGLPALSVAHYGEQNGDAMRDPEMCFEIGYAAGAHLISYYWRNDYVAVEQVSRAIIRDHYVALLELGKQHERFTATWDNNLRLQGYEEAFTTSALSANSLWWSGTDVFHSVTHDSSRPRGGHHAGQQPNLIAIVRSRSRRELESLCADLSKCYTCHVPQLTSNVRSNRWADRLLCGWSQSS